MTSLISKLVLIVSFLFSTTSVADVIYQCEQAGFTRTISVVYQDQQAKVPCEVNYDKGEGEQKLWWAENEQGYCEFQAEQFVEKQRGWGWSCDLAENDTQAVDAESDLETDATES